MFTKPNYYSSPKTLGLKVLERNTLINGSSSVIKSYNVYFGSTKLLYFRYNDTFLGTGISGSQITICECDEIANDIPLTDLGNGLYTLDFKTETRDGHFKGYIAQDRRR